ncbi:HU family DNA-binding protein [Bacteroides sp.]
MPLFYKGILATKANKEGAKTWHPTLVKMKKVVNTQTLAEEIAEKASLTPGDVQNVVRNLLSVMRGHLLNSYSVRLEGLGTFTMKIRSRGKGVDAEEKVNPNQITSVHCRFTPEYFRPIAVGTTRALMQGVTFAHANLIGKEVNDNGGGNGEGEDPAA